jgi:hypothetical protein
VLSASPRGRHRGVWEEDHRGLRDELLETV